MNTNRENTIPKGVFNKSEIDCSTFKSKIIKMANNNPIPFSSVSTGSLRNKL